MITPSLSIRSAWQECFLYSRLCMPLNLPYLAGGHLFILSQSAGTAMSLSKPDCWWGGHLFYCVCVCARARARMHVQSCLTLCNPMDCSPLSSSVYGIFQGRILEWVAMPSSRGSSRPRDQICIFCIGRQILYHCDTWEASVLLRILEFP